jgi:hypothetical protein
MLLFEWLGIITRGGGRNNGSLASMVVNVKCVGDDGDSPAKKNREDFLYVVRNGGENCGEKWREDLWCRKI